MTKKKTAAARKSGSSTRSSSTRSSSTRNSSTRKQKTDPAPDEAAADHWNATAEPATDWHAPADTPQVW